ncbi:MAG TPA: hypothetical protein VEZ55_16905, partial [Chitinophagaceae bacterium]|nr:hypothetical protein [Chitinophagaceae bacterium]
MHRHRMYKSWILMLLCMCVLACKAQKSNDKKHKSDKTVTLKIPHHPLRNERDLDVLMEQIGDARIVLLGEASHGTAEYYTWRTAISKRLIQEKDFNFIAVEG